MPHVPYPLLISVVPHLIDVGLRTSSSRWVSPEAMRRLDRLSSSQRQLLRGMQRILSFVEADLCHLTQLCGLLT
jgi:hypothetical protein